MVEEKPVVMESGTENQTLAWGQTPDGKANVRETSSGDLTETILDAAERMTTITFEPNDDYSLDDVADTVESHADDCFITDIEDALGLWGIPYKKAMPLPA